jgi:hypothetical protein
MESLCVGGDVVLQIVSFAHPYSILSIISVCKGWNKTIESNWETLYNQTFVDEKDWKQPENVIYRELYLLRISNLQKSDLCDVVEQLEQLKTSTDKKNLTCGDVCDLQRRAKSKLDILAKTSRTLEVMKDFLQETCISKYLERSASHLATFKQPLFITKHESHFVEDMDYSRLRVEIELEFFISPYECVKVYGTLKADYEEYLCEFDLQLNIGTMQLKARLEGDKCKVETELIKDEYSRSLVAMLVHSLYYHTEIEDWKEDFRKMLSHVMHQVTTYDVLEPQKKKRRTTFSNK